MYLNSSAKVQGFVDYFKFNGYTLFFFSLNCPLFGQNVYKGTTDSDDFNIKIFMYSGTSLRKKSNLLLIYFK